MAEQKETVIRKAKARDIGAVERIYCEIHSAEEAGELNVGWARGVYPTRATAEAALSCGDLFVLERRGEILAAALINKIQVDCYRGAPWQIAAPDENVCVLHTLVVSPRAARQGLGRQFVRFYEDYAAAHGCTALRMDTNARNAVARALYQKLGYAEIGVVPTVFNGIPNVQLVLLEKAVGSTKTAAG